MAIAMANLSEDLISEVFVRLPGLSLMRCKCVCKTWLRLIKSPDLVDMHLKRSNEREDRILISHKLDRRTHLLSVYGNESLELISSLKLNNSNSGDFYIQVAGPCDGLFCVLEYCEDKLMLYNPSINECKWLSPPIFRRSKDLKEESIEHVEGFGLGSVSNPKDYKVVLFANFMVIENEDDDEDEVGPAIKAVIYDLSTDCWRKIECDCPDSIDNHESGILFNGALHWIAMRKGIDIIVSFDMSTEILQDLDVPEDLQGKHHLSKSLMIFNGSLALCAYTVYQENLEEQVIDIWVMKETWSKQISIGPLLGSNHPRMLWKNEAMLLRSIEGQLLSCSLQTHEIEKLNIQGKKGSLRAMGFKESLVSIV